MSRQSKQIEIKSGVSTLKQCQAKLEQARARAEAADRSKSQFLTNVRHEIRTLNRIMGFNHRPKLTKRQKEYSNLIRASSKSLLSLFDDVLDRGNIETAAEAKAHCPGDTVVWANTRSKIYHYASNWRYGRTKSGAYMCEKETATAGMRAAKREKRL